VKAAPLNYSETGENMTDNVKRTIGDNSANINPIEDSAINFVRENIEKLIILKRYCERAFSGKNKTIRNISAMNSAAQINCILNDLKPWQKVIDAKSNGVDIHSTPIKTHKLDIVANRHNQFGQYIVDKDVVWTDEYGDTYPTKEKLLEATGAEDAE
jgi:hypothetical protein|tara:strand:+ start:264 stop:734 length:471 start_codon:yes stop_codon:yes gene_type:complete